MKWIDDIFEALEIPLRIITQIHLIIIVIVFVPLWLPVWIYLRHKELKKKKK